MKRFYAASVAILVIGILSGPSLRAQSSLPPETSDNEMGLMSSYSFAGGGIDNINLSNGNVAFNFPLVSYPQRGGVLRLSINAIYNSKPLQVRVVNSSGGEQWLGTQSFSNPVIMDADTVLTAAQAYQFTQNNKTNTGWIYSIQQADGTSHVVGSLNSLPASFTPPAGNPFESLDGTGWRLNLLTSVPGAQGVISPSGVRYIDNTNGREDSNGNKITENSTGEVDTMGRVIPYLLSQVAQVLRALVAVRQVPLQSRSLMPGIHPVRLVRPFHIYFATLWYPSAFPPMLCPGYRHLRDNF